MSRSRGPRYASLLILALVFVYSGYAGPGAATRSTPPLHAAAQYPLEALGPPHALTVADVNGDGLEDVFFTANQLSDRLYLNKGNLQFQNITEKAGVAGRPGWKTGVSMADVNGDGRRDIYVCYSGNGAPESRSNQLFINKGVRDGIPYFIDEAKQYGLDAPGTNSTQSVFFDYDRDGDLDMFLLNHATMFYAPLVNTYKLRHKRHPYFSNYLFRNDGGRFTEVSSEAGIAGGGNNFGLGVVASESTMMVGPICI